MAGIKGKNEANNMFGGIEVEKIMPNSGARERKQPNKFVPGKPHVSSMPSGGNVRNDKTKAATDQERHEGDTPSLEKDIELAMDSVPDSEDEGELVQKNVPARRRFAASRNDEDVQLNKKRARDSQPKDSLKHMQARGTCLFGPSGAVGRTLAQMPRDQMNAVRGKKEILRSKAAHNNDDEEDGEEEAEKSGPVSGSEDCSDADDKAAEEDMWAEQDDYLM